MPRFKRLINKSIKWTTGRQNDIVKIDRCRTKIKGIQIQCKYHKTGLIGSSTVLKYFNSVII